MPLIVMRLPPVASNLESTNPVAADTEPDEDSSPRDPSQALVRPTGLSLSVGFPAQSAFRPTESNLWSPS